jgi:hypothetical protein
VLVQRSALEGCKGSSSENLPDDEAIAPKPAEGKKRTIKKFVAPKLVVCVDGKYVIHS